MKEQTRKDMQQKLADYRQPAPEISWAELEKALAANRRSKAVPIWGKLLATAAAVLLVAGLGWQLPQRSQTTLRPSQQDKKETSRLLQYKKEKARRRHMSGRTRQSKQKV